MTRINTFIEKDIQIVKLSAVISAGRIHEFEKIQSLTTAKLIGKGTVHKSATELDQLFDFFGASFEIDASFDDVKISLSCLKKHFFELNQIFFETIYETVFHQDEFDLLINNRKEKLKQILSRNDYLSDRHTGQIVFGEDHPYGYAATIQDYDNISITSVQNFYDQHYTIENSSFILVGDIEQAMIDFLESKIKNHNYQPIENREYIKPILTTEKYHQFNAPNILQSSIKISWMSMPPNHEDFNNYSILNTILGGYFGSRLMQQIREEKGYTYGIYSQINTMLFHTYTSISTEINAAVIKETIEDIKECFLELQSKLIDEDELNLVKNYLKGEILRETDGSFRRAEAITKLKAYGLDENYFVNLLQDIENVSPKIILDTANQYLNFELCYIVIV